MGNFKVYTTFNPAEAWSILECLYTACGTISQASLSFFTLSDLRRVCSTAGKATSYVQSTFIEAYNFNVHMTFDPYNFEEDA